MTIALSNLSPPTATHFLFFSDETAAPKGDRPGSPSSLAEDTTTTTTSGGTFLAWCFNINQGIPTYNLSLSTKKGSTATLRTHLGIIILENVRHWRRWRRRINRERVFVTVLLFRAPVVLGSVSVWRLAVLDASSSWCVSSAAVNCHVCLFFVSGNRRIRDFLPSPFPFLSANF